MCLNNLDDFQLALVILRLYESDLEDSLPSSFKRLLQVECLGYDPTSNTFDSDRSSSDPFIRSMAYWILKDYSSALETLLDTDQLAARRTSPDSADCYATGPTSVFNFYNYLRTHPLIVRQHIAVSAAAADAGQKVLLPGFSYAAGVSAAVAAPVAGDKNVTYVDRITPIERRLYFMTAHAHFVAGCPALALEVLTKLPAHVADDSDSRRDSLSSSVKSLVETQASKTLISTGTFDSSTTADAFGSNVDAMDWSQPAFKFEEETLDLGLESSEDEEDEKPAEAVKATENHNRKEDTVHTKTDSGSSGIGDIMAHQLKFIACIKIMVDELSTLATGFEVDGGQLRYQLYVWLEKEVAVLKRLCNYGMERDGLTPELTHGQYHCLVFPAVAEYHEHYL